ncbi:MAG TPA: xanthine dehydrogenase molybdopterin binding subunit [Thermoanaerobaculia bacterium]|nr:xanthine dehydrogenase molybdopterin binding subunit [Thermoanaerobaculia bacterium]
MYVGKNVPHDSARGHVTGESMYIDDLPPLHGELVVDFVWSPYAHARIRGIELPQQHIPGVVGLYTYEDLAANRFGPVLHDEPLLAEDVCTFRGQPIVVIAAESLDAVRAAKAAIRVDLEELQPILTIDDAVAAQSFIGETRFIRRGDAESALASADHVLEGVFECGGQDHFYLESQAALVVPGEHDALTVHSSTQHPTEVQEVIAHLLGIDMSQVVVQTKRMGGAFGGKEAQATHPAAMAALVARKTKRPARIVYDKDSDMHVTGKRHPFQNRYRAGFTRGGEIVAYVVDLYSDGGAYADLSTAVMARAMTHAENAYYIPHIEIRGTVCRTNMPPNTAFRGFGGPQGVATIENVLEEIAAFLKRDPLDVRRANCYGGETRNTTPYEQVVANNTLPRLFSELEEKCEYRERMQAVRSFNESSRTHLRGLSMTAVKFGISFNTKFLNQANALVNVYLDGSVQVSTGATEMGQGVNTKIRQLVADELRVGLERVVVMVTSTEKNNNTSASAASSAADLNGSAAVDAAHRIRMRLDEVQRNHGGNLTWEQLIQLAYRERVSLGERGFYATPRLDWDWTSGRGTPFLYFTMGTACAEVLIDRFTGELKVERCDVLMDIGRSINPGVDRGQLVGGFIQGMGWVTTEELRYTQTGELLSHSPTTYKIPNVNDLPPRFSMDWIDVDNAVNVGGSKAVGEPPLLTAISVWCAVKHALGFVSNGDLARLRLPATNEEILMRLTEYTKRGVAAV